MSETQLIQPVKKVDHTAGLFNHYHKNNKHDTTIPHCLSINFSKILDKNTFNPELYITYLYDVKSSYNFVYIPSKLLNKYNLQYNVTRDHNQLKIFSVDDFEFAPIPNAADNSKYIKSVKNPNIRKISTQQYILKNLSRWVIPNPSDNSSLKAIYKTKSEIPEDQRLQAIEIVAKPKIMIRIFKNTINNNILIQFTRYYYNVDTIQFVNHRSKFEFTRYSLPVYVEIYSKEN